METKKTDAVVELADNGYIMRYNDMVLVYTSKIGSDYRDMIEDIMSDLKSAIKENECTTFHVKVEVEPITKLDNGE